MYAKSYRTQRWTWVGSIHRLGWVGLNEKYCYFVYCTLCLLQYYVLRKLANNASYANTVYRQSTRYSCLQKKAGLVLRSNLVYSGWEFSLQLDNQSITTRNRMFISSTDMQKYGFYSTVSAFHVGVWLVGWVGLGWVKKNGPSSISDRTVCQTTIQNCKLNR